MKNLEIKKLSLEFKDNLKINYDIKKKKLVQYLWENKTIL